MQNSKKLFVLLAINELNVAGGLERQLISIVNNLHESVDFIVFLSQKMNTPNQYADRLFELNVPVNCPGVISHRLLDFFIIRNMVSGTLFPFWLLRSIIYDRSGGVVKRAYLYRKNFLMALRRWLRIKNIEARMGRLKDKPDIVHIFRGVDFLEIGGLEAVPIILTEGSVPGMANWWDDLKPLISKIDCIIAVSHATANACREYLGFKKKLHEIYSMIDLPGRTKMRKESKQSSKFVIGSAARFTSEKNQIRFIEAVKILKDEYRLNVRAMLAGNGPLEQDLKSAVAAFELSEDFEIVPPYTGREIEKFMLSLDLFILCSHFEGTPSSIAEAMGFGLPVVATDVGGTGEMILDGVTGILVEPDNSRALADAIAELISDPESLERMGKAGRSRFEECFSAAQLAPEILEIYKSLSHANKSAGSHD